MSVIESNEDKSSKKEISGIESDETIVLKVLGDTYSRLILQVTAKTPKSAQEIHDETKIPMATLYRRIQWLEEINYLGKQLNRLPDGKWYFKWYSLIQKITLVFSSDGLFVQVMRRKPPVSRIADIWKTLRQ